jgi:hypothetical protein
LVRSAIGVRLAPRSLRQAPRFGRAHACASPGIRVSRSGLAGEISNEPCFGKQNTLRSCWLGRVRVSRLSIPLRRDRSHEPGVRCRLPGSHSTVGRVFRTRIASHDSCSCANPMFALGRGDTPQICKCQHEARVKIATVV